MTAFLGLFGLGLCLLALAKLYALVGAVVGTLTLLTGAVSLFAAFSDNPRRPFAPFWMSAFLAALAFGEVLSHKPVWAFGMTFAFALVGLLASAKMSTTLHNRERLDHALRWIPLRHRHAGRL